MDSDTRREQLAALDDDFDQAVVKQPGELPPDGTYQAIVDRFDFFESKGAYSHEFLKTELKIADEDHEDLNGWPVDTVHCITDPERLAMVKDHLQRLGWEADWRFSDIEEHLPNFLDLPVEIAVVTSNKINEKTGQPYRNVYVNQVLGPPLNGGAPADPEPDVPPDQEGLEDAGDAPDRTAAAIAGSSGDDDIPF